MNTSPPSTAALQILQILAWPSIGPAKVRDLARALPEGESILTAAQRQFSTAAQRAEQAESAAREITDRCTDLDIAILSLLDNGYPAQLKKVNDAPPLLFVRGSARVLSLPSVAVVGTRQASSSGSRAAWEISRYLAQRHYSVVSGLALGIDAAAHQGALEGEGVTVAVLAHGLDRVTPTTNLPIAERLLATGGALVSEHPPGVPPRPPEFARRNRIQSGLSLCSIVVESGYEGGAMIQANFTRQQGRPLFAVVPRDRASSDLNSEGANRLIAEFGAKPISGTADLAALVAQIQQSAPEYKRHLAQGDFGW